MFNMCWLTVVIFLLINLSLIKISFSNADAVEYVWRMGTKDLDESYIASYANSKFRNYSDISDLMPFLRNKRIIFVGDSLTRYQYINLVRYLHSGRWTEPLAIHPCCEKTFGGWDDFYAQVSISLGCNHICDCRNSNNYSQENHYYYDPDLNLTISSHLWFGVVPMTVGSYFLIPTKDQFTDYCHKFTTIFNSSDGRIFTVPPRRYFPTIFHFLEDYVKPSHVDVLIANFGHWEGVLNQKDVFKTKEKVQKFCEMSTKIVPLVIWKTTTAKKRDSTAVDTPEFLRQLARCPGIKIFDAYKMTVELAVEVPGAMWDPLHYYSFVYRELNIALLEHLKEWEPFSASDDHIWH